MAANKQSDVNSNGWAKWQIALAIGTPIALGLGYWYYRNHRSKLKRFDSGEDEEQSVNPTALTNNDELTPLGSKDAGLSPIEMAQNMKNKGNKFFKGGKYDEAIKCYSEAISLCPENKADDLATFYQNRAAAYEQLKNYNEVIQDCSKALELNCKYTKALNRRAKAYEVNKNLQKCLEDVTSLCILEGFQNQPSLIMADRVLKQLGRDKAQEAMKKRKPVLPSYHFIKSYFSSFSCDPIMAPLKNEDMDTADLSGFMKAREDLKQFKYENIIEDCSYELKKEESPFRSESLLLRATFYIFTGQCTLAQADLNVLLDDDKLDKKLKVNAMIKLGSMKIQEEKPQEAIKVFNEAEAIDPDNCDLFHHRGQIHLLIEKMEEAIHDFDKAVKLNPKFPIAFVQKCYVDCRSAFMLRNLAGIQHAVDKFEDAIKQFPSCVEGHTLYGQVLMDQHEFAKADACFQKALTLDPDNSNVYVHRGLLYLQWKQDLSKAVELIKEGIKKDDKCEFGFETLGTIEVQRGNLQQAVDLFNKAIALAKTEAEMAHLYSLNDAAQAQAQAAKRLGISIPPTE